MMTLRQGLEKRAWIIGAGIGALRTSNLTDEEKDRLRERYGLSSDANLAVRNAGRGIAGMVLGTAALPLTVPGGALAGAAPMIALDTIAAKTLPSRIARRLSMATMALPVAGALAGGILPVAYLTKKLTDKYSKSALDS